MATDKKVQIDIIVKSEKAKEDLKKFKKALSGVSHDVDRTAKTAREFSVKWGVSFSKAWKAVSGLEKETAKETSKVAGDMNKTAKAARKFASDWNISFSRAWKVVSKLEKETSKKSVKISNDVTKMAKAARKFSQDWGVSFSQAYKHVSKLNTEIAKTKAKTDMSLKAVGKRAKTFAKEWGVSTQQAMDYQKNLVKEVKSGGIAMVSSTNKTSKDMSYNMTFIAWHFRYLGNIMGQFSRRWRMAAQSWVQEAADIEEATFGIKVAAAMFGQEAEGATNLVKELVSTGLIEWKDASEAIRNLLMTGIGIPELKKMMWGLLSQATAFTVAGKDLGDSINKISAATLRGTALMQTDLMTRTLLTEMTNEQKKSFDRSWSSLTKLERTQLLYNKVMEKSAQTGELWRGEAHLMAGQVYSLQTNIQLLKASLGQALRPALDITAEVVEKLRILVEKLSKQFGSAFSIVTLLGISFTALFATFAFGFGVVLSFVKILNGLRLQMIALNTTSILLKISNWQFFLGVMAISGAIVGLTYLYLKATGRLDKWKDSMKGANDAVAETARRFKELGGLQEELMGTEEDAEGIDEDRRISHERRTADIEENLERERSKGLWANQMIIKDLEKRLKRENEDWNRYLLKKGKGEKDSANLSNSLFDKIAENALGNLDIMTDATEEFQKTWRNFWEYAKDFVMKIVIKFGEITIEDVKNAFKSMGEAIKNVLIEFDKLPIAVQGGLAGLATYITLTFIPTILKKFLLTWTAIKTAALLSFAKIRLAWTILSSTIALPIAISIVVAAAVIALQTIRQEIAKLKQDIEGMTRSQDDLWDMQQRRLKQLEEQYGKNSKEVRNYRMEVLETWQETSRMINQTMPFQRTFDALGKIKSMISLSPRERSFWGLPNRQFGGIVPGPVGQPVPIMAHGGERIVPSREPSGGNITVNINNPVVREENDIQRIVDAVSKSLGQRTRFSRMGAF